MTHTEKAHLLFGVGLALIGGCALYDVWWPASRARLVWPVLTFLIGAVLFVPVETQGRTYDEMGWWDVLWSFVPDTPSRWMPDWIAMVGKRHVWRHKIGVEGPLGHARLGRRSRYRVVLSPRSRRVEAGGTPS